MESPRISRSSKTTELTGTMCGWSSAPWALRLPAAVERDLQDDLLAPQREVPGQEDPRRPAASQQRDELEFLEGAAGLRETAGAAVATPAAWLKR